MKKLLKSALIGLPMVLLAACSAEEPVVNNDNVAEKTETRYLKVNLVNATGGDGMSRAIGDDASKDYASGTEAENKIRTIDFYFYDADKQYHSHVPLSLTAPVDPTTPGKITSVHGFYATNVPVSLVEGDKMPTYVICVVNAVNPSFYENKSMADAQSRLLDTFYGYETDGNTANYFGMSNSVYYGRDEVKGAENELIMATPFDSDKLFTLTELEAMDDTALENATIDIYVERYAAKVNFNLESTAVSDFVAANGVTLTFEPAGWGMNAYEKKFFFLKSYRPTADPGDLRYDTYDTMNGILFAGWNRPDHFRSFWARTPAYYDNNYPLVADDILDEATYPYSVYYQSFTSANNAINSSQYVMESTLKGLRLTGVDMPEQYLPLTSIPSVVLVGKYKVNGVADKTFYTYGKDTSDKPVIYSETDGDITGVTETISHRLLFTQTVVLKSTGTGYTPVRPEDNPTAFVVEHPKKDVRTGLKIGGDLVTLQINATNSGYYYYNTETGNYEAIDSEAKVTKVNRLLYQNLGGAHCYTNGMAFFSAPIQHWGWYRAGNVNKDKAMNEWDWSKMKTGDFGVVRNHVYTVNISRIKGLGTGIINVNDPLLPPTDKVSYAVRFRVNIQKWATLPTQTWEW